MKASPYLAVRALNADPSIFDERPEPAQLVLSKRDQEVMVHLDEFLRAT